MNINLHIERIILEGLPVAAGQGAAVQAAIEAELTRLLAENGLASHLMSGGATPRIAAGEVQSSDESSALQLGQQIARAVHEGIAQ
jgi:hypothetical protein